LYSAYRLPGAVNVARLCRDLTGRTDPVWQQLALRAVATAALLLASPARTEPDTDTDTDIVVGVGGSPAGAAGGAVSEQDGARLLASVTKLCSAGQVHPEQLWANVTLLGQAAAIVHAVQEALAGPSARRVPPVIDLAFSVAFLTDPADDRDVPEWTYAVLYTDRAEFQQVWEATPGVQPWPYWNNTDAPGDVEPSEWDERAMTWKRVLGQQRPSRCGTSFEYTPATDLAFEGLFAGPGEDGSRWLTLDAVLAQMAALPGQGAWRPGVRDRLYARLAGEPLPLAVDVADPGAGNSADAAGGQGR